MNFSPFGVVVVAILNLVRSAGRRPLPLRYRDWFPSFKLISSFALIDWDDDGDPAPDSNRGLGP
jgi:hypothetical protein